MAMASISIDDTGVGSVKHDVGERGDSNVTPVSDSPLRVIVGYVARVSDEVPRDAPAGKIVEKMAGEDVPKLISAAEDARRVLEPMVFRSTVSDPGMPEVVSFEETAVAAMAEETTWMVVESIKGDNGRSGIVDAAEERSGPSPSDKEIGVTRAGGTTSRALEVGKMSVAVEVPSSRADADTSTAVVDDVSSFSLGIDRSGFF